MDTDFSTPPNEPTAAPKRWSPWLTIPLMLLGGLLAIVLFIGGSSLLYTYTAKEVPVDDADKAILLEAHELAEWAGDFEPNAQAETYTKQRYFDGSYDIEYEYEDDEVYISNLQSVESKVTDATSAYAVGMAAAKMSFKSQGFTLNRRDDIFSWGRTSEFYLLELEGDISGMLFFFRDRERYGTIIVAGYYSDDRESVEQLLGPATRAFKNYDPK